MALRCFSSCMLRYRLIDQRVPAIFLNLANGQVEGRVAVGKGADDAGAAADFAHDALEWVGHRLSRSAKKLSRMQSTEDGVLGAVTTSFNRARRPHTGAMPILAMRASANAPQVRRG
jgi:hypothetical protein